MKLRSYQVLAADGIQRELKTNNSTLIVMPTGCGKTQVFTEIIRRNQPGRALVLAHRSELIWQAVKRIEGLGINTSVEMASLRAGSSEWTAPSVVVSSIQTQIAGENGSGRMTRFDPKLFDLLIIDEAHHATAKSYRRVIDYYRRNPKLKVLGVTATPDRADENALGQVFETVAYDYEILDAIREGWLVPVEQMLVEIKNLDFSAVKTTAGDLNGADLAQVMESEANMQGVASAALQIIGDKRSIVFTVSVAQAEMLAEILNRHKEGMADWVCGKTKKDKRKKLLDSFATGEVQVVVNVGVLTEGFDNPAVEVIIQARPTKSRSLYSQMVGRAIRPLPGVVDGPETDEARRAAIAASDKPSCLVVDFVGNSGRHKLMTSADILGGKVADEIMERAIQRAKDEDGPVRMDELISEEEIRAAEEEEEERKRRLTAIKNRVKGFATISTRSISPFDAFDLQPPKERGWDSGRQLSIKQNGLLRRAGIEPKDLSYRQATQLIGVVIDRRTNHLASYKQSRLLLSKGYDPKDMTMKEASAKITEIAESEGWADRG